MTKCSRRGAGKLAAPPPTRTKRKRVTSESASAEVEDVPAPPASFYLQLRSRSIVFTDRRVRLTPPQRSSTAAEAEGTSRCSINATVSEVVCENGEGTVSSRSYCDSKSEKRDTTPASELRSEDGDLESTIGVSSTWRRTAETTTARSIMPTEAEIEEFFEAAERDEKRRFVNKYNYDVVNDVPLDGRYEWIRI